MGLKVLSDLVVGNVKFPAADGSNGQVLRTDGSGNLHFATMTMADTKLSGLSFNTGSGVLTATLSDSNTVTVDLDGRYAAAAHVHDYDNYSSWNLKTNGTQRTTVQSGGTLDLIAGSNVALSYSAGGEVTISSSFTNTDTNNYITGASFDTGSGVLSLSRLGLSTLTVDLDGRFTDNSFADALNQSLTTKSSPQFENLTLGGVANPRLDFNGVSDTGIDMSIVATPEGLDFIEPEQENKIQFQILDDTGVNSPFGYQWNGQSLDNRYAPKSHTHSINQITGLQGELDGKQPVGTYLTSETLTELSISGNILSYRDELGNVKEIDLKVYLDDSNLSRLTSGVLNGSSGIATFTRDDSTTFTVDFSALLSDVNNYITGLSFNTTNGVLTATRSGLSNISVDLDNRYLTSLPNHNHDDLYDALGSAKNVDIRIEEEILPAIGDKLDASVNPLKNATVSNDTITFTRANGTTFTVTTSDSNTWRGIHDTPVDGASDISISSNWAFDNVKTAVPAGAKFTDTNTQLTTAQVRAKFSGSGINTSTGVITNTTYAVGDGGRTEKNFTSALKTKLDGISTNADVTADNRAADSVLAGGLSISAGTNNKPNTIVRTNNSGYADFGWINTTSGNTTGALTDIYVNTNDGYIRKATPAHFRSQITDSHYDPLGIADAVKIQLTDRIDNEVLPIIPTNNNQLDNGAGYITLSDVPTNNNQLTNGAGYITSIPTASSSVLGGVKVGDGLSISNGVLSAEGGGGGDLWQEIPNGTHTVNDYSAGTSTDYPKSLYQLDVNYGDVRLNNNEITWDTVYWNYDFQGTQVNKGQLTEIILDGGYTQGIRVRNETPAYTDDYGWSYYAESIYGLAGHVIGEAKLGEQYWVTRTTRYFGNDSNKQDGARICIGDPNQFPNDPYITYQDPETGTYYSEQSWPIQIHSGYYDWNANTGPKKKIDFYNLPSELFIDGDRREMGANSFIQTSDRNKKESIVNITSGLDVVGSLQGVTFDWKSTKKNSSGFIAQDVKEVIPHAVEETHNGVLALKYSEIIAYQNEAIKELKGMIEELRTEVNTLKNG